MNFERENISPIILREYENLKEEEKEKLEKENCFNSEIFSKKNKKISQEFVHSKLYNNI